jgi:quinoprotein glucose dehydrogenase
MFIHKLKKYLLYIFIIIFTFTIYELTNFNFHYVNKPLITIDINNIRNPQIKKLVRFADNYFSYYYFKFSKKKKEEFYNTNEKNLKQLPEKKIYKTNINNLTTSNNKNYNNNKNWLRSHGNHSSNKFSSLEKINLKNISKLDLYWIYEFDEKKPIPGNPIFFDGNIFVATTGKSLVSIDVLTGKKNWEFYTEGYPAIRGLLLDKKTKNLYFCDQYNLISIQSKTGTTNKEFGNNGKIKLKHKCHVTPAIIDKDLVIATFEPSVEVYDLKKGKIKWKYYLKKKEKNFFRYGGKRFDYSGGNPWGGISADIDRKIIYVSTGNAGNFHDGTTRPGSNEYSNSVVAIDVKSKKLLWAFQEIEHDLWNYDIASPPILASISRYDKKLDVVVVPTKYGNTLVLDRVTGESLYDYEKVKAPLSDVPGEKTANYQKNFPLPEAFSRKVFYRNDVTKLSKERTEHVNEKIKDSDYGFFIPPSLTKKNIIYKGGAQWMGASIDNNTGTMFVNSNNIPSFIWLEKTNNINSYYSYSSGFSIIKDQFGYPGSTPPWGSLTSIDLNNGKINWQVPFGEYEELSKQNIPITGTINYGGVTATDGNLVFATGTIDKKVRAFNSQNGTEVWSYKMDFSGSSPPTIFEFKDEQYILVVSTGSQTMKAQFPDQTEFGNKIYLFKLRTN